MVEHVERKDEDRDRGNRDGQRGHLEEQVRERGDHQQDQPDKEEFAEKAEVALRYRGDGRHDEEHARGHRGSKSHELTAVLQAGSVVERRRQREPGDEREAKNRHDAPAAVPQRGHYEERPDHRREKQKRRHDRRSAEKRCEIDRHADEGSGDSRYHRQRQQPVRVAQDLVRGNGDLLDARRWHRPARARIAGYGFQFGFHRIPLEDKNLSLSTP